ncbi:hypothetical protein KTQ94_08405 [Prevotella stercorea]|jgi:hypothetical protein|uniref:hypothetical protein n=1 Tax=Leyella stercorea TaxID=363265 RepID=UPI001C2BDE09|nr:hypothetical protein [Leyella stercorea]MBU9898715.1 hypothetical protein [Leyella stercorea]MBU9946800.1 hypothetical protein [Leyella stercorea]
MFYNKKITMFGHEIYCRDNNRYMTLPHKQVVTKSGFIFNLPNPETEIKVNTSYYLEELYYFGDDSSIVNKFLKILDWIYEQTQRHYDEAIVKTLVKYCPQVDTTPMAPFFTIIYLAMLDWEIGSSYPVGSGKLRVYKSCKAALLHECDPRMFSKKDKIEDDNIDSSFVNNYEDHYERTDSSPENDVMDALENGNGDYFGY